MFVPLVGERLRDPPATPLTELAIARQYLESKCATAGVDTLILGCTHYPLLTEHHPAGSRGRRRSP